MNLRDPSDLASLIDHTLLRADATPAQIEQLCREAIQYGFAAVCINPGNVPLAAQRLEGTPVKVCTVIGFPLGATTTLVKVVEARDAIASGATELDMVMNIGALKARELDFVRHDIAAVVNAAAGRALVKVIIEACYLTEEEKRQACSIAKEAGAAFVKTSTGFGPGGATVQDVMMMRQVVGPDMGIKAAGGIRDYKTAVEMIRAGATRIGTSSGVAIMTSSRGC
ncbi:MAG TPA: deoxyribose-phosphate aldolase [Firmicutes bacterium]|nr:deoxyribose-phosphate aldolase [Bacillota bacterium]